MERTYTSLDEFKKFCLAVGDTVLDEFDGGCGNEVGSVSVVYPKNP